MRLIDADALVKYMCDHCGAACNLEDECCSNVDAVENTPTINPEDCRPHGRWIRHDPDPESMRTFHELGIGRAMSRNSVFWTCSCCANWGIPLQNYCSNCGATMDEEADNGN